MDNAEREELIEEVLTLFCRDVLNTRSTYESNKAFCELEIRVVSVDAIPAYFYGNGDDEGGDDDEGEDDNPIGKLAYWLQEVQGYKYSLRDYDFENTFSGFDEFAERVEVDVTESASVAALIGEIADTEISVDEANQFVWGGMIMSAQSIAMARLVFGGKRHGLTETLFKAYSDGLFPFGFDEANNVVLCVRPKP